VKRYAVAFTGPSDSGKTTLIEKISRELIPTHQIAIIKNDPKDKAIFDIEGKDSYKFNRTGAEVAVVSPTRTTLFSHRPKTLYEMVEMFGAFDYLFVEGLKTLPLPRIAVFRGEIDLSYLECSEAIAIDESINPHDYDIPATITLLPLNDTATVIEWIKLNAKEI
jgi:molybdopterin-guanine dinucleotide biosynthesis adapter protein